MAELDAQIEQLSAKIEDFRKHIGGSSRGSNVGGDPIGDENRNTLKQIENQLSYLKYQRQKLLDGK